MADQKTLIPGMFAWQRIILGKCGILPFQREPKVAPKVNAVVKSQWPVVKVEAHHVAVFVILERLLHSALHLDYASWAKAISAAILGQSGGM